MTTINFCCQVLHSFQVFFASTYMFSQGLEFAFQEKNFFLKFIVLKGKSKNFFFSLALALNSGFLIGLVDADL
jgi:hypothetical protein